MILLEEHPGLAFRDDILRGVRLFAIAFAAILVGVWAYRSFHLVPEVQGAQQDVPSSPDAPPEGASPAAAPVNSASTPPPAETHGLVVPPPPPVGGNPAAKPSRVKYSVPPPPDLPAPKAAAKSNRPTPTGRDFETPAIGLGTAPAPATQPNGSTEDGSPAKKSVGYKSLLEASGNRPAADAPAPAPAPAPVADVPAEQPKGNRFFRAVGKIFKGGNSTVKKEPLPLTIQQQKQP